MLLFVAGFVATSAGLRTLLPRPATSLLARKLDAFERDKDAYDTVFLGSSTVYRHVDPAVFDRVAGEGGVPTRSYNLGAAAMGALELRFALHELLAMAPENLRTVFVDVSAQDVEIHEANLLTGRVTWWHDLSTTRRAVGLVLDRDDGFADTLGLLVDHLRAWAYNLVSVGRVRPLLMDPLEGTAAERDLARAAAEARDVWELGPAGDGFCALDDALALADDETRAQLLARRAALEERAPDFRRRARAKVERAARGARELTGAERALLTDLRDAAGAAGVELVFFTSPSVEDQGALVAAGAREGLLPVVLDFGVPTEHPELFDLARRFDWNHLDRRGATLYTTRLAGAWLASRDDRGSGRDG